MSMYSPLQHLLCSHSSTDASIVTRDTPTCLTCVYKYSCVYKHPCFYKRPCVYKHPDSKKTNTREVRVEREGEGRYGLCCVMSCYVTQFMLSFGPSALELLSLGFGAKGKGLEGRRCKLLSSCCRSAELETVRRKP